MPINMFFNMLFCLLLRFFLAASQVEVLLQLNWCVSEPKAMAAEVEPVKATFF